jgi:hypothetical protein
VKEGINTTLRRRRKREIREDGDKQRSSMS